jgi:hypothetical protein
MKKLLLAGLVMIVSAISMGAQAQAGSRYCYYNPEDPACYAPIPDDENGYYAADDENVDLPMWDDSFGHRNRHRHHMNDAYNYNDGSTITLQFGSAHSCSNIAQSLKRSGFRRVKPIDCAGRDYAFIAFRGGERLKVGVKSATGRISTIQPY